MCKPKIIPISAVGIALFLSASYASAQDAAAGGAYFKRTCSACHNAEVSGPRKLGPSLFQVVGRKAGTLEGYRFSTARRDPGLFWTAEKLDRYLMNPREFLPGTTMAFAGVKNDSDRASVIAYLETLK